MEAGSAPYGATGNSDPGMGVGSAGVGVPHRPLLPALPTSGHPDSKERQSEEGTTASAQVGVLWCFGVLLLWFFGVLMLWCFDALVVWYFGASVLWLFGALVFWCFDALVL